MTKLYQFLLVVLLVYGLVVSFGYSYKSAKLEKAESKNTELEAQVTGYKNQLEKVYNDKMELDRKYKQLEDKANSDKDFNWYADISRSPVVLQLHD